jgi:DNA polymerase I-like protein with 3'-5' exonuclease and polymerase domains
MEIADHNAVTLGYVETILGRRRHLPFAKKINDVLSANGIDWQELAHAQPWMLRKGKEVIIKSKEHGGDVRFTEHMYEQIRESIKFREESGREGGYWAYIRSMLKGDLNNAKNNPIQGLAGHIANRGMLDTNRKSRAAGIDAWVCLQVHDEITKYARTEVAEQSAQFLRDGMEKNQVTALLDIAMIADPVICDNLKESK